MKAKRANDEVILAASDILIIVNCVILEISSNSDLRTNDLQSDVKIISPPADVLLLKLL